MRTQAAALALITIMALNETGHAQLWGGAAEQNLLTGCEKMRLSVSIGGAGAKKERDAERDRLRNAVEARLRIARLYKEDARQWLMVDVLAVDPQLEIVAGALYLMRWAQDTGFGVPGRAIVWQRGFIGGDPRDEFVDFTDQFIAEYLRTNSAACGR